jgi:alkanesulfonate monooxygenase SsuD/methylene tetrahydromethanopterin reductase-like flavin-dependent oxidoreductase (luciferase family)
MVELAPIRLGVSTGLGLWYRSLDERRGLLDQIADSGIDHVFFADHVSFHDGSGKDGMVQATGLANLHETLGVYAGVYLLALRHPVTVARQICDIAVMAPGRFTFGVGVGGEDRHEVEVCGIDPSTRGRRTDAALDIVVRLLNGETVDHDSEFFSIEQANVLPAPAERVPIMVGGRSDAAVVRAGKFGDGWLASWCSARRFAEAVGLFDDAAVGRTPSNDHGLQVWAGFGETGDAARTNVADAMEDFYKVPFAAFEKYTPWGSPADVAEQLVPYIEAGARHINLMPCGDSQEHSIEAAAEVRRLLLAAT